MRRNSWRAGLATIVLTGIAALAQVAPAQTVVAFESDKLYSAVVDALGLESGADVLDTDMLRLTKLRAPLSEIHSLSGLEYATYLAELDISYNVVPDLNLLMALNNLRELDIRGIPIKDIGPLADLTRLKVLNMANTEVADLAPLAGLVNLRELDARYTMVRDLTPLSELSMLEVLKLSGSPVESVVPLEGLSKLRHLELNEINTSDFESLGGLPQLTHLQLQKNGIESIRFLDAVTNLGYLDLSNNQVSDLSPLRVRYWLPILKLGWNRIEDLSPIDIDGLQLDELAIQHNPLNENSLCYILPRFVENRAEVWVSDREIARRFVPEDFSSVCADPEGDADGDTLSNLEEANLGTLPDNADTDADGHTDGAEQLAGSSPFDDEDSPGAVEVEVPDIYLEHAIRLEADRPTGPLFIHHLEQLDELRVGCGVASLEGLQYAINLEELSANCGSITDLTPLVALSSLKTLSLVDQEIEVLPDLTGLTALEFLNLSGNPLGSLEPLAALQALAWLELNDCGISDASPIGRLTQLALLHMSNNPLDNIEFVGTMPKLQALQLDHCGITDIQPIAALESVGVLSLRDNLIEDISPLRKVARIQSLLLSNNKIREISALSGQLSLIKLNLNGNEISSVGALAYPRFLVFLDLSDNRIERAPALGFSRLTANLDLSNNLLRNIGFLPGVRGLANLDLSHNRIEHIGMLPAKLKLRSVNLSDNHIKNIAPLKRMHNLVKVYLANNQIEDASALLDFEFRFEELDLSGNQLTQLDSYEYNWSKPQPSAITRDPVAVQEFCDYITRWNELYVDDRPVDEDAILLCNDPEGDLDADGLANYDEFIAGSYLDEPDSDHDGFTDGEEVAADSYAWHQDSIPIDNPNTTPLPEMAAILLARYDEITTAPNRARLFYVDCQVALPGMTYQDFEALDENGSDGLSVWELELHAPKGSGCHFAGSGAVGATTPQRGDLSVLGLLLGAMALIRVGRNRN